MKTCSCCKIEKPLEDFYKKKRGKFGVDSWCKRCCNTKANERAKERRATDPEFRARMYEHHKKYVASEKGHRAKLEGQRRYLASEHGRAQTRKSNQEYRLRNAAMDTFRSRTRHLAKRHRLPAWVDIDKIIDVYLEADRLTISTGVKHHVDHIVPLHSPIVSGLHWHQNLRAIPANENVAKGNMWWPDMPDDPLDVVRSFGIKGRGIRVGQRVV